MALSSVIRYVRALDTTSVVGAGKTGLAFGDITAKYIVEGGTLTSLTTETITTLGTYQAPTSAAHIRIKELSASDPAKGEYEVHFHDTQVAAAGKKLWLFLSASNALFEVLKVDLLDGDVRSIAAGVITATSIADGAIDAATFAAGAINAAAIATGAIDADALATDAVTEIAAGLLDLTDGVESGETLRQWARLVRASLLGNRTGFPAGPGHFRDRADTKDRITAVMDGQGNATISTDAT